VRRFDKMSTVEVSPWPNYQYSYFETGSFVYLLNMLRGETQIVNNVTHLIKKLNRIRLAMYLQQYK